MIGCGPIGIMAAQVLKAFGLEVVSTEINDHRVNIAKKIRCATVVDVKKENPVRKVINLTDEKGAYFVLEAAATQSAMDQAFELVRP